MKRMIITNNPLVGERITDQEVSFFHADYLVILEIARDQIHLGHQLLTHPLAGSVKPGETPYKTVVLSAEKGLLDDKGLSLIEESIQTFHKLTMNKGIINYPEKTLADFQLIDYHLIFGKLE